MVTDPIALRPAKKRTTLLKRMDFLAMEICNIKNTKTL
jgi:hypothetical protein